MTHKVLYSDQNSQKAMMSKSTKVVNSKSEKPKQRNGLGKPLLWRIVLVFVEVFFIAILVGMIFWFIVDDAFPIIPLISFIHDMVYIYEKFHPSVEVMIFCGIALPIVGGILSFYVLRFCINFRSGLTKKEASRTRGFLYSLILPVLIFHTGVMAEDGIKVGQPYLITLNKPANRRLWILKENSGPFKLIEKSFKKDKNCRHGFEVCAGTQTFKFESKNSGAGRFHFVLPGNSATWSFQKDKKFEVESLSKQKPLCEQQISNSKIKSLLCFHA